MSRMQKGAKEKKQEKGVRHEKMLRLIKGEESEDAGLRRATQVQEKFRLLERGRFGMG